MKIGPYEVLRELGRGGMGVVYHVRGPDGREAALKLLTSVQGDRLARFERERRLLASLGEEEGFVGLVDAGVSAPGAWLVMPFLSGGTLRHRLEAGPLGVEETIALGRELARALGAAHERGIVHRDVKPENVLFKASGRALLADLGLAKHFDRLKNGGSQSVEVTKHGVMTGTAAYMAPEQIVDAKGAGPPADVFALGAVLYECLEGRPAFSGDTVLDVLTRVSSATVEPIARPDAPKWLEAVVRKALAREPGARFPHGGALARALTGDAKEPARRSRRALVLAFGAVVAGGGLVALALPSRQEPRKESAIAPRSEARELLRLAEQKLRQGDVEGGTAAVNRAIELDPGFAPAWTYRGALRSERGDEDGAIRDQTRAIELDPGLALAWARRGIVRYNKGEWEGTIVDATKSIELDPTFATAWEVRGIARGMIGDRDGEIADETRAISIDPRLGSAWMRRGVARGSQGDFEGQLADSTKAIELDPTLSMAWVNRGVARGRSGDLEGQISDSTKAIELDPKNAAAWTNRGYARGNQGDLDGEMADETKAIELDPRGARGWMNRAVARAKKGDTSGAIEDTTKALEIDPGLVKAWLNRGVALFEQGQWDASIADETKAIELSPRLVDAWRTRGTARARKGDLDGALADLEHALELEPDGVKAAQTRRELEDVRGRAR